MAFLRKMNAAAIVMGTLLVLGVCCCVVHGTPNTTRRLYQCNPLTYKDSSPYRQSVEFVLDDLLTVTANTPGYDLYNESPFPNGHPAFGRGTCNFLLSATDCANCIAAAYNEIIFLCHGNIGGKVYLHDCSIRYESYPIPK